MCLSKWYHGNDLNQVTNFILNFVQVQSQNEGNGNICFKGLKLHIKWYVVMLKINIVNHRTSQKMKQEVSLIVMIKLHNTK